MPRFNYIVTIHNKEDLIERVVNGILIAAGATSHIYLVLDGCTDGTEAVIDRMMRDWVGLPITKLFAPDVHEIRSLNIALRTAPQEGDGFNILVQDDVMLREREFEKKVIAVYKCFNENIGVLSFRHGANVEVNSQTRESVDIDIIESIFGHGLVNTPLQPGYAVKRMVCFRSPQCISFETIRTIGLLDDKYAPYMYDDHDYGLRCLAAGLDNVVYALKTVSRLEWGGMRRSAQPGIARIIKRNMGYVYADHADFIRSLRREDFLLPPVKVPVEAQHEDLSVAIDHYRENRADLEGFRRKRRLNIFRRLLEKLPG